ncbi:MAG: transglycosylase family protein [Acidimicrobiia bacterium]|nr:transglycosylase family protein [Acidimicrobiia bacterium]
MAEQTAGFARAARAGAWFSASPRVQRVTALHVAIVLAAALGAAAVHRGPAPIGPPLALAAATGPETPPGARAAHRSSTRSAKQARKSRDPGWAYWSVRIRGCESHGRPDAPPDYAAKNPHSSASGAYQILDSTWVGRFGVRHASEASPAQQEAAAAELYRRYGTASWAASAPCWRLH